MTFVSPLNTFVRLLTTTSAQLATSTLTKLPTVSSTMIRNPYSSASSLNLLRLGDLSKGFEGNSQNNDKIAGSSGFCERRVSKSWAKASRSDSVPWPKKWHPGPHFCRILRVSVYGKLCNTSEFNVNNPGERSYPKHTLFPTASCFLFFQYMAS